MRKNKSLLTYLVMAFTFTLFISCSDEPVADSVNLKSASAKSSLSGSARFEQFNEFKTRIDLGEDISKELAAYIDNKDLSITTATPDYNYLKDHILRVLNPEDYSCDDSNIPLSNYINGTIANWTFTDYLYWAFYGDYPVYDAIYFKEPGERQSYGVNGEYTNQLNRTFKDLKRFWDINSDDINMFAMKGTTYADIDRVTQIELLLYPFQTEEESRFYAELWNSIFGTDTYWNFNHPLFSFNAFALSTTNAFIQDRIVMGDGIMMGYEEIGLGDVAPQAILAHEYAHQIQFENGYFEDVSPEDQPEATRRTELMADAYSAYYLTHKRGATMNWWRVEQFLEAFYNIGDCSFDGAGHHGTHNQRMAAAEWGRDLAANTKKKGKILSTHAFFLLFEDALDDIVNCDTCN